jgi:uncharacterized protein YjeT (DUF2065 family)
VWSAQVRLPPPPPVKSFGFDEVSILFLALAPPAWTRAAGETLDAPFHRVHAIYHLMVWAGVGRPGPPAAAPPTQKLWLVSFLLLALAPPAWRRAAGEMLDAPFHRVHAIYHLMVWSGVVRPGPSAAAPPLKSFGFNEVSFLFLALAPPAWRRAAGETLDAPFRRVHAIYHLMVWAGVGRPGPPAAAPPVKNFGFNGVSILFPALAPPAWRRAAGETLDAPFHRVHAFYHLMVWSGVVRPGPPAAAPPGQKLWFQ